MVFPPVLVEEVGPDLLVHVRVGRVQSPVGVGHLLVRNAVSCFVVFFVDGILEVITPEVDTSSVDVFLMLAHHFVDIRRVQVIRNTGALSEVVHVQLIVCCKLHS